MSRPVPVTGRQQAQKLIGPKRGERGKRNEGEKWQQPEEENKFCLLITIAKIRVNFN